MTDLRLAISGKMLSGKSLVAAHLVKRHGFKEIAFADKIKGLADDLFVARKVKDRLLLVEFGERMRGIDAQVWIRAILRAIPTTGDVVVSDLRFPAEFDALTRLGFVMVRTVTDRDWQESMMNDIYPGMPHILLDDYTETALDHHPFPWEIHNEGPVPLEDVYASVDTMMEELRRATG